MADASIRPPARAAYIAKPRALMVAAALTMSGIIISLMVRQYLTTSGVDDALIRSRLWWEVVLNLQILSAGTIWFAFSDAIGMSEGSRRRWYIAQCSFTIISVLLPTFLGTVAAFNNWFEVRPDGVVYWTFLALGLLHWLSGLLLRYLMGVRHKRQAFARFSPLEFLPVLALIVCALLDTVNGGTTWLMLTPFLLYLQGSIPYLKRGLARSRN